jgi:uncharacterized membrane protein
MNFSENNMHVSANLVRLAGYGILVLWLIDLVTFFTPPRFTNPVWEFETMGKLVDSVGWALVAFVMIFFGEDNYRLRLELPLLKILSWMCLGVAILYFVMLPLGLANTWRINNLNNVEVGNQLAQRIAPLEQVQAKLNENLSDAELVEVFKKLLPPNTNVSEVKSPRESKEKLLENLNTSTAKIKADFDAVRTRNFRQLVKNSVKWNLGTAICAVLFIYMWRISGFYRNLAPSSQEEDW